MKLNDSVFSSLILDCVYFSVGPSINVQEHHGNDKSCVWHAADFADGELKDELFCIRFASVESMYFSNQFFTCHCF